MDFLCLQSVMSFRSTSAAWVRLLPLASCYNEVFSTIPAPPLIITEQQVDEIVDALEQSIKEVMAELVSLKELGIG